MMALNEISIPVGQATPDVFGQSDRHLENMQNALKRLHGLRQICRIDCCPCSFTATDIIAANINKVETVQLRALDSALCAAENSLLTMISLYQMRAE